jgi:hypothetical protein
MTKPPSIDDKALAAIDVTGAPLAKSRRSLSPQPRAHPCLTGVTTGTGFCIIELHARAPERSKEKAATLVTDPLCPHGRVDLPSPTRWSSPKIQAGNRPAGGVMTAPLAFDVGFRSTPAMFHRKKAPAGSIRR